MTKRLIVTIVLALSLFLSSTKAVNASDLDVSVIDINALWTKNTVRITFNSNGGGAAPADQVYAYGVERSLPGQSSMSKEGYSFIGWSTSSTATTPEWHAGDCSHTAFGYANADSKTSKTLYAVWKANDAVTVADFLGYGKSSSTPSASEYDTASLVEKVNYLEDRLAAVESTANTNSTNISSIKSDVSSIKSSVSSLSSSSGAVKKVQRGFSALTWNTNVSPPTADISISSVNTSKSSITIYPVLWTKEQGSAFNLQMFMFASFKNSTTIQIQIRYNNGWFSPNYIGWEVVEYY